MKLETSRPLPNLPPNTTTVITMSGERYGVLFNGTVMLVDGATMIFVDRAKKEYYRRNLADQFGVVGKAADLLKNIPGFKPPKITIKPASAPRPGPAILGVATTTRDLEMNVEMEIGPMTIAIIMKMENAIGQPSGWEALAAAQKSNATQMLGGAMDFLKTLADGDAVEELMKIQTDGVAMRMRMVMSTEVKGAPAGAPPIPPIGMTMTTEMTEIVPKADMSILEIPSDFREVPPPAPPRLPTLPTRPAAQPPKA